MSREVINVKVYSPTGQVYSSDAYSVFAPSSIGETEILPNHATMYTHIKYGVLQIISDSDNYILINNGLLEITHEGKMTVYASFASKLNDLPPEMIQDIMKSDSPEKKGVAEKLANIKNK